MVMKTKGLSLPRVVPASLAELASSSSSSSTSSPSPPSSSAPLSMSPSVSTSGLDLFSDLTQSSSPPHSSSAVARAESSTSIGPLHPQDIAQDKKTEKARGDGGGADQEPQEEEDDDEDEEWHSLGTTADFLQGTATTPARGTEDREKSQQMQKTQGEKEDQAETTQVKGKPKPKLKTKTQFKLKDWAKKAKNTIKVNHYIEESVQEELMNSPCHGYLFKRSPAAHHKWEKRWFLIKSGVHEMYYYGSDTKFFKGKSEKGSIYLLGARLEEFPDQKYNRKHSFGLTVHGAARVYVLAASNAVEYQKWLQALQAETSLTWKPRDVRNIVNKPISLKKKIVARARRTLSMRNVLSGSLKTRKPESEKSAPLTLHGDDDVIELGQYRITASSVQLQHEAVMTSTPLGQLTQGQVIQVLCTQTLADGTVRAYCSEGWLTMTDQVMQKLSPFDDVNTESASPSGMQLNMALPQPRVPAHSEWGSGGVRNKSAARPSTSRNRTHRHRKPQRITQQSRKTERPMSSRGRKTRSSHRIVQQKTIQWGSAGVGGLDLASIPCQIMEHDNDTEHVDLAPTSHVAVVSSPSSSLSASITSESCVVTNQSQDVATVQTHDWEPEDPFGTYEPQDPFGSY